jgi:DNA-binding beta-propeller fold protein YncE
VYTSLAFSPNGTPYVAYEDYSHTDKATVMEYSGTGTSGWVTVGLPGFSANTATFESLAFSPNGTPYVAYRDAGNGQKATVMEYNGGSWVTVGSAGFSANTATQESLAFSPNGTPYVAYDDFGHSNKATVMEYNGASWAAVGSAGFSAGVAGSESLAFSPNGMPYVAYEDAGNGSGKATVMEFFTPPTAATTAATSVAGSSATLNGTVNDEGTATTVTFQYGTTISYGTTVTATTPAGGIVAASSGSTAAAVSVTGLLPLTTYHYTVSATANGTTVNGDDMTFTTSGTQPTVTGLSPSFGAAAGGGTITITGITLDGATAVSFGATAATNVVAVSSTSVTATIPAGTAGSSVSVTVTTTNGTSAGSPYTYSALTSYTAPTTAVGAISATQTAYVNFTAAGTLTTIDVLTLGATGLDFNEITGGTCTAGTAYSIGQVCSVEYGFTPLHPGQRMGAVQLISSAGAVMGTSLISGIGSGPQVVFATTTTGVYLPSAQNTLGGGFSNPEAAAVDGSGNVYVADFGHSAVKEIPAGCASSSCVTTLGSGFSNPTGVAVDGAGNVYVADFGHSAVKEMVAVNGSIPASPTINTLGGGFSQAEDVAVDGSGNVYVGDTSHNAVKVMPSGCASSSCVTTLGGGFSNPSGLAVDGSGNVFVADTNNSAVKEIPSGCALSSCVTTLGSGFSSPQGVAVDGSGDIYVADTYHAAVKEMVAVGGSIPVSPTILTLGSGFSLPFGAAVDGSGNVYVADNSNNAVKKLDFADPPSFSFATTYVDSVSADSPKTVTLSNIGNAALTFEVPGTGTNPAISLGFSIGNSSTCPQLSTGSSAGTLGVGASCTDLISFTPQVVGTIGGSTVTTDNTLNIANSTQSVGLSGTSILLPNTITFPQPTTPVTAGSSATLAASASNNDPVTYTVTAGTATITGSTIIYTNAGTVTIAANSAQTADYAAAATVSVSVVVNASASSYTAPTEPVGNTSATQTASVTFTTAGTLGSINVVTKGATNLDFNSVGGGTCATGTAYTAGQACTVEYSFKPLYPGAREGAVVLQTSGGSVLGTSYLGGTGTAPLGLFTTTSQTLSVSGLSTARGLSADGYGNLYVLETGNGNVDEIAAGTNTVTTLTNIVNTGSGGTAVDGAGNLYVGATGATTIYELVGGKLPVITVVTGTCGSDDNLEVDGAGNLYFTCYTNDQGAIYKVNAVTHALTELLLPASTAHRFIGLAVDAAGDIYAPDFNNDTLYELPFGANSLTTLVTGGALSNPHGVAVDPAGNIYVTNYSGSTYNVLRYAASGYALTKLPATGSRGIVIDGSGNLFTIQSNDATITGYARTTAPGLTFPNTPVGASNTSLQTVEFENDGNAALAITSYSATTNFNVGGSGNTCATGSLASGASCFVGAHFAPTTVGTLTGSASIVDNTLGIAGTSQNIPLSGTGTLGSKTITFPQPTTPVTVNSTATLTATASNGDAVTYSITSGAATINGTTITYTNAGTVTIAANSAQTAEYAAAVPVSQSITVNAAPLAYTAPTTAVGSTSATQTAMVNFTTAGTPSAISVVTQGVTGLDFAFVSGGTCSTTTAYTVGQSCTVQYTFTPKAPGLRFGGITLSNSSGTLLATSLLAGTGVGPALAFSTSVATNVVTSGLNSPQDVIVDAAGNLYITNSSGTTGVVRVAAGSNTPTAYATSASFSSVVEVAIDGAGNLYVTDWVAGKVFKVVGSSVTPLVATTFSNPQGIVVDPTGNVFFADQGANTIYKVAPGATSATVIIASTGGLSGPTGLAIDSGGNLYVSDAGHNLVKRIASGATATTTVATTGFTLNTPEGIAVDSAGNLYINDLGNNRFVEIPANGQAPFVLGTGTAHFFMSLDSADRLYAADVNSKKVFRFDRTVGTPLAFPNTTTGTSSTAQLLNVENDGNASLAISSIAASNSNFTFAGTVDGSYSACGPSLAYGWICGLGATFTPQSAGTLTANGNVTDNSLNVSGATQTVALSGVATQIPQTITFTSSAGPYTYGHAPITLSATGGASGNAVTFSLISGPGSVSGSMLTITGAGTIVVAANQAGSTNYSAATQVTQTVVVNQGAQAITFTAPASPVTYGAAPAALVATGGSSTKPVVFSVLSGPGSISGSTLSYTGAGTVVLAANQAGDINYTAATQVTQTVVVNQAPQTINFSALPSPAVYGVGSIPLAATGGASSNGVIFTVISGPAVISGNSLTIVGAGTVVVAANQAGNANYSAAAEVTQSVLVNQAPQAITFTVPSVVLYGVAPITLNATGGASGNAVVFSVLSGPASITGNLLTITGTGTVVIAADQLGNTNYTAAAEVTQSVTVLPIVYTAPTEPVGTASGTQTATLLFNSSFTLGSINVLTQGAPGLDFNAASGGTCAVGASYSAGQTCTVNYTFTPIAPGTRFGAITIVDNSTNLQASLYLIGSGTGPLALFSNGGQSAFQNTSGTLNGITTDAAGNVYYTTFNTNNNGVYKVAAGSGITTLLVGGLQLGDGVAIDGAGNVFYTDYNAGTVNELLGGTGTPILIATEPNPEGLAFDAQGNLYVVVSGNLNVVKLLAGSFTPSTTYGTGLAHPQSVAVDASGNVYITDRDGAKAVVVTPDGTTQNTIANGIATPAGITLDAAGNIYIAVIGGAELEEFAAGTYAPTTLGSFTNPAFVALDPSGNVLVADRGTNTIQELTRATPAPLSFATTSEGSTSSDSPQTVTLTNDGNASLVLSGLTTASANFSLSGSSTCSSSTTLAINGACTIGVNFAPTVPGSPLTDAVTIADNNLNVAGAVQTEPLSGTGTQQTAIVTVAPTTISYTTNPTTLSATVAYLGATAPSGAVSFTIDGSGAVPAICAGSSSPLTCTAGYSTGILSATAHTIIATLAADTDFATTSGAATLTVTPIAPTITFAVPNHTYGDAAFTLLAASNSGAPTTYSLVSGPASVSGSTLTITGAGTVTVQAAQIAAGNYIAGSQNASFTVVQLTLTAAIVGNPTKTYDSTTGATLTSANYQLAPLVSPDAITVTQPSGVYASATAGPEGVTAALSSANFNAGSGLLSNYILPAVATGPGTITQAATSSTILWSTPAAITYGTALSVAQLNASSTIVGSFSYSPAAGTVLGAATQTLTATFTPTDTTDYKNGSASVTLLVNQATPTISWANPVAISYGTHLSATQLNATASVAGTFSYNPAAGSVLTAGPHLLSVTFTPTDGTDYTTATATVSLTVAPIALTITSGSPTTTYGSTLPTIAPSYSGFIFGDSASSLTTQPTCTTTATSASNVGSYPTSCSGAVDANYTISYKPGTLTVTPAVLTVAANKLTFAYGGGDGDNDADSAANPLTYTITGFALGQTAATDLTGTPSETSNTPEGGPVGSYTITMAAGSLKLKSAYSSNYTISYVSAPLTIIPAVLTVTATSQSDVYGAVDPDNCGQVNRHLTYTISGFAYNQKQNQVLDGSPTLTTTATAKSNVGSYPITITQGSLSFDRNYASNYTLVFVNGTLTVTPAKLNVVANSYSRQINQPNPAFGYTINGFVNGDSQTSATTGAPACCSTTGVTSSPVGIYAITIAPGSLAAKNGNYTLTFVNGVLVVYNPNDRDDRHGDGNGNYRPNPQYDSNNWPDNSSYNYYWGNGGGGPNITH